MFKASNNEVEYETLMTGIKLCYTTRRDSVQAFSDSQLVVSQVNGAYKAKDDTMEAYVGWVREATKLLKYFAITSVQTGKFVRSWEAKKYLVGGPDGK